MEEKPDGLHRQHEDADRLLIVQAVEFSTKELK